jgi:metallo-beta-lactamase family protein
MHIKFLGATGQVTGSSFLLTSGSGEQVLIDCGMFQGSKEVQNLNRTALEFDPSKLLAVVLTHAHLDHCGRLPLLPKYGFSKNMWDDTSNKGYYRHISFRYRSYK